MSKSGFQLYKAELAQLKALMLATRQPPVYRRTFALLEVAKGRPVVQVARQLGVSRWAVYGWLARYRDDGHTKALGERRRTGRPRAWSDECSDLLRQAMDQGPNAWGGSATRWTVPDLREFMAHRTNRPLSEATLRRRVRELGYVWDRSGYRQPGPSTVER